MKKYLNLGCGGRYSTAAGWTNVDFISNGPEVLRHDLNTGLPFPDGSFDAVFHSHLLEHFTRPGAERLMRECVRVLKPGGVCRVVVPDMEDICRQYLRALEEATSGRPDASARYNWMIIELCDQLVRHRPGGAMAEYLRQPDLATPDFVISRIGNIAKSLLAKPAGSPRPTGLTWAGLWQKRQRLLRLAGQRLRRMVQAMVLTSKERAELEVGHFRLTGEPHLWMYDRYSLPALLSAAGLASVEVRTRSSSRIGGWNEYHLDVDADGSEHAPDSLYAEGTREA